MKKLKSAHPNAPQLVGLRTKVSRKEDRNGRLGSTAEAGLCQEVTANAGVFREGLHLSALDGWCITHWT
jgi:hypothetical protein